ncbi:family 20 glycosylhydrolase [Nocardioides humilatus]|uniref:Family 20 glycosylhydrolase n=1 Tax=Nocardioides humilatus TaxID=2607660 RepID=A0A5B1L717_9ACTN|nr:family 20 glycosylhydrolase [Nocardioides humilatus]KAA1415467.1 family 20 glycosylhydrolase [Nocardioides humilatus]
MKRAALLGAAVASCAAAIGTFVPAGPAPAAADVAVTLPATIPAVQQWRPATGTFTPADDVRIVVPAEDAALLGDTADLLAQDLAASTDLAPTVAIGTTPRDGDILLDRIPGFGLRPEGYRLQVGDVLAVKARDDTGAFYGTRSVIQMLRQQPALPRGVVVDWPRYPDRGLLIDAGRRYFSPAFYRTQIERMSYLKLNLLHLHISDDAGLGIESELHPEAVADQFLTQDEVRDLVAFAHRHHVRVIPEIDMPGHMLGILEDHPELQLRDFQGTPSPERLDITNPDARAFAKELLTELLPLFPDADWHLGGDEYLMLAEYPLYPSLRRYAAERYGTGVVGQDALIDFMNEMAAFVQAHGKVARMWNDGAGRAHKAVLDPDVVVEWWTDFSPLSDPLPPTPATLVKAGHQTLNNGWWPTYYGAPGLPAPSFREAYGKWQVHHFYGTLYANSTVQVPPKRLPAGSPANRGSQLSIWSDGPAQTDDELLAGSLPGLRLIAQKTWESPAQPTYDAFEATAAAIGPTAD